MVNLVILMLLQMSIAACYSLPSAFFPYRGVQKGFSQTLIGIWFGSYAGIRILCFSFLASIVPKIGIKFCLCSGGLFASCCLIMFAMIDFAPDGTTYIIMCFLIRAFEAVGFCVCLLSIYATITELYKDQRILVIGICQNMFTVGEMLGPAVGGMLYDASGFMMPFLTMGVFTMAMSTMAIVTLPAISASPTKSHHSILKVFSSKMSVACGLIQLSLVLAMGFYDATFSFHLETSYGISASVVGLMFLIMPTVEAIVGISVSGFMNKYRASNPMVPTLAGIVILVIGLHSIGPSYLLPWIPRKISSVIGGCVLLGIAGGLVFAPSLETQTRLALQRHGWSDSVETHSLLLAAYRTTNSLGLMLGPIVGGFLSDEFGFSMAASFISIPSFALIPVVVSLLLYYHVKDVDIFKPTEFSNKIRKPALEKRKTSQNSKPSLVSAATDRNNNIVTGSGSRSGLTEPPVKQGALPSYGGSKSYGGGVKSNAAIHANLNNGAVIVLDALMEAVSI